MKRTLKTQLALQTAVQPDRRAVTTGARRRATEGRQAGSAAPCCLLGFHVISPILHIGRLALSAMAAFAPVTWSRASALRQGLCFLDANPVSGDAGEDRPEGSPQLLPGAPQSPSSLVSLLVGIWPSSFTAVHRSLSASHRIPGHPETQVPLQGAWAAGPREEAHVPEKDP